jgi:hypothetical protein
MKKLSKPLHLRRETILALDRRSLEAIRGGDDSGQTTIKGRTNSCNSICQCNA